MRFKICPDCEVRNIDGDRYCVNCSKSLSENSIHEIKDTKLDWKKAPSSWYECEEASQSLKYALIGLICFGFILQPYAIYLGVKALSKISEDPTLTGDWKAWAGIIIGVTALGFTLLSLLGSI